MSQDPKIQDQILGLTNQVHEILEKISQKKNKEIKISQKELNPRNIQQLLVDLDLGINNDFYEKNTRLGFLHNNYNSMNSVFMSDTGKDEILLDIKFLEGQIDYCTKTRAKFFSDIWFSLSEQGQNPDLVISLWDLDKKLVLEELKEILLYHLEELK